MALELNTLRGFLEQNSVVVKYIKNDIIYCAGPTDNSSLKVIINEDRDEPYKLIKEDLSGNVWSEKFETKDDLVPFLKEKQ